MSRRIRQDFPSLAQQVHGKPLAYLDNAASAQTPLPVIDAIRDHYLKDRSNVHRGVHELSQRATNAYEKARVKVKKFINAATYEEIIWTRGTTEGINLVASSWGRANVKAGDEILVSALEHHSNIVPWQMLCERDRRQAARHSDEPEPASCCRTSTPPCSASASRRRSSPSTTSRTRSARSIRSSR